MRERSKKKWRKLEKRRTNMLSLPKKNPTDTIQLADWLEIYALISGDKNSSRGDLESALRAASLFEPEGDEAIQQKLLEVFQELEDRTKSADHAYPFHLEGGVLSAKECWEEYPAYVFCLCAVRRRGNVEELALGRPGLELLNREHYAYYVRNIL